MSATTPAPGAGTPAGAPYTVLVLVEDEVTPLDATQIVSLHEGLDAPVSYVVLLPVEDAAERVAAALGTLGSGDPLTGPSTVLTPEDLQEVRADEQERAAGVLATSLTALRDAGARIGASVEGRLVGGHPVDELVAAAHPAGEDAPAAQEAIVLTAPHVVAEFFGLDWAAQARRHLDLPVLHLLERETFEEQSTGLQ